ncbi:hypothetical protein BJ165DRAFT_1534652 [Panaeolus papilionaceus]|nr:hypothetical protein BJ165DRAFT_1534652 [Panaeolus papilionaceus]
MSTTRKEYNWLHVKGDISVAPVTPEELKGELLYVFLLMGPTGSGKSSFIEALSPDQNLEISKDSLDSVTKGVVCYQVVNLTRYADSVIVVDTPGFLDCKLSESRITSEISDTLERLRPIARSLIIGIMYFQPITDLRFGGTKRGAVKLLKAFAQSLEATGIKVVSTMWNHISTPRQMEDAHGRLRRLEYEIFEGSDRLGMDIIKFEPSRESALSILDAFNWGWFHLVNKSQHTNPQYQSLILSNLVHRITNIQLQLQILAEDKRNATMPGRENPLLLEVVIGDEEAALATLQSFLDDLVTIGPNGLMAIESLLDACYNTNPSSSSSPWPQAVVPSSTTSLVPVHSLRPTSSISPTIIQDQGPPSSHVIHSSLDPRSASSTSHQPQPSPSPSPSPLHNSLKACLKYAVAKVFSRP